MLKEIITAWKMARWPVGVEGKGRSSAGQILEEFTV